jgi:hypothetical protein
MKVRVLHQAIMVALLGAFASTAGATGDAGKSTQQMSKQPTATAMRPSAGTTTQGPEVTAKGEQGKTELNAQGSTDRSANQATGHSSGHTQAATSKPSAKTSKSSHDNMAGTKGHESDRHAAVKKCAQQADQNERDRCLDQVVAQYGS